MSKEDPIHGHSTNLSAKHLRQLHTCLVTLHTTLTEEQCLIERIWYKSHAQFRTQRWFQSVDGVRRCLRELVGFKNGHDRKKTHNKMRRERRTNARAAHANEGHLVNTIRNLVSLYFSLSHKSNTHEQSVNVLDKLPKLVFKPRSSEDDQERPTQGSELTLHMALSTLQLIHLLLALQQRSQAAFTALVTHLRTPPAPTFAPVVLVLMSVVANVSEVAKVALQGQTTTTDSSSIPSAELESKPLHLIQEYHSFVDASHLTSGRNPAQPSGSKRKRESNVDDNDDAQRTRAPPPPAPTAIPLELRRYPKPLQSLVNIKRPSTLTLTAVEQSILRNHLPHRIALPFQNQSRAKRRRTRDRLPGLKQLTKQRRNLLDEYEDGNKRRRQGATTNTSSASSALLDQFLPSKISNTSGMFTVDDDEEDIGLAV